MVDAESLRVERPCSVRGVRTGLRETEGGAMRVGFFIHLLNYSLPLFFLMFSLPTCVCFTALPRCNSHMIQFTHSNYTVPLVHFLSSVAAPIITAYKHFDIWLFLVSIHWQPLFYFFFRRICSAIYLFIFILRCQVALAGLRLLRNQGWPWTACWLSCFHLLGSRATGFSPTPGSVPATLYTWSQIHWFAPYSLLHSPWNERLFHWLLCPCNDTSLVLPCPVRSF